MGIHITGGKLILYIRIGHTVPDIAEFEAFLSDKLVAGIQVAPRCHRHIFCTTATARNTLIDAGSPCQINHVVVESKGLTLLIALQHQLRQLFILLHHDGQIFLGQLRGVACGANHRLHAQLCETKVQHLLDIFQKIRVGMGEGATHIVVLATTRLHELLELGNNLLPTAIASVVHTEAVVNLLASVQT